MKLFDILEHSMGYTRPHSKWSPELVLRDLLGADRVAFDEDDDSKIKPGMYVVSRPWVPSMEAGMFSDMDCKPGEGGAIGLKNMYGKLPDDIAAACHEGCHAVLHATGGNYRDEKLVNQMAEAWLRKNLSGIFLHLALDSILKSKISYGHN